MAKPCDPELVVLVSAAHAGLTLEKVGDRLKVTPGGKIDPAIGDRLRAHKQGVLAALGDPGATALRIIQTIRQSGYGLAADELREMWGERMGICTFEGKLTESDAARVALTQLLQQMALGKISIGR